MTSFVNLVGVFTEIGIRSWVRLTGQRVAKSKAPWLKCPTDPRGRIGAEFYTHLSKKETLSVQTSENAGRV